MMNLFKNRKLKKNWGVSFGIFIVLALYLTHIINIILGVILNKSLSPKPDFSKVNDYLFSFKFVTKHMLDKFDLMTIFIIFLAILLGVCYLLQGLLFNEKGYSEADEIGIHGTAKWGDPNELRNGKVFASNKNSKYKNLNPFAKNIRYPEILKNNLGLSSGYILGKVPNENKLVVMEDDTDISNMNVLVFGPPGSGKSQSYVIPNIVNVTDKSIIVTDPKGELKDITSQLKKDQGYKVYQVDFLKFKEARYNPLYYVENELQAKTIANTMFTNVSQESGGNSFFKDSATNILAALIIYVKTEYDKEEANMRKVIDVYNEHVQDEEKFNNWVDTFDKSHPAYDYMIAIKDLTDVTRKSVTATLNTCFDIFKVPEVQEMTATSDFNFEDFIEEKSILYVKLSMEDDTFAPLTSVFFAQMISVYMDIAIDPDSKLSKNNTLIRRVAFYLDEFANIGKIGKYAKTLSTCRSLGLSIHTIIQNKAQLEKKNMYGQEEAREIISSHDSKLILRADRTDTSTTEWISKSLGDTTISQKKNDMTKSKGNISKQIGDNFMKRPLMTPEEVATMKNDECLLLVNGYHPLKLEKAFQSKIYPNMLSKKTKNGFEYNYDNVRNDLGYTSPIEVEQKHEYKEKISFSNYRELQNQKQQEEQQTKVQSEQQQMPQNDLKQNADREFTEKYDENKSNVEEYLNGLSNEERQEAVKSLNNLNSGFSEESQEVNGITFYEANDDTKSNIVSKAVETTSGKLKEMKENQQSNSTENSKSQIGFK